LTCIVFFRSVDHRPTIRVPILEYITILAARKHTIIDQTVAKGGIKNREAWAEQAVVRDGGATDEARPWIQGFVRYVGEGEAKRLLGDAGLPSAYKNNDTTSWTRRPRDQW
jgi:hypothetical protein